MIQIVDEDGNTITPGAPSYYASPGVTHLLTWQVDPATYNDAEYSVRLQRAVVARGVDPTGYQVLVVDVPTTQSSFSDQHTPYVINGRVNNMDVDVYYYCSIIRRSTGVVVSPVTRMGPYEYTYGECQ